MNKKLIASIVTGFLVAVGAIIIWNFFIGENDVQNGMTAVQVEEEAVTACDAIQGRHWKNQERNAARMREYRKPQKKEKSK